MNLYGNSQLTTEMLNRVHKYWFLPAKRSEDD